jgi:imidazolonepropionase-like amidohydrolase
MNTTMIAARHLPACVLTCALASFLVAAPGSAQTPPAETLIIVHANVIDGVGNAPLMDQTVIVADGRIASVGSGGSEETPRQGRVIDLKGRWLLPGFVDAHVHVGDIATARRALESGATTIASAGINHFADVGLRELNHGGAVDVPDVIASGYHVRPRPADEFFLDFPQMADLRRGVRGADNVRRMVRAMASRRVDRIKILSTERAGLPDTDPRIRIFNDEELGAIVDEANKAGLKVISHAHGDEGAAAAVRAGVHAIEHGTYVSDETLRLMKDKGVYLDPTMTATIDLTDPEGDYDNPILQIRGRAMLPVAREMVAKAWRMGVKIIAGTDTGYAVRSNRRMADEMIALADAGVPAMDAIKAGTSLAAESLGIEKRTGSIRVGYEADLVAIDRNPLTDIRHLGDILLVVNNGKVALTRLDIAPRQ